MNDEAKKVAVEYLQKLLAMLEKGADFAGEQIPLVLQEIVAYGQAYETFICVFSFLVMCIAPIFGWKWCKKYLSVCESGAEPAVLFVGLIPGIATIVALHLFFYNIDDCLKAWFAPRLYVIEYLHDLIKTAK